MDKDELREVSKSFYNESEPAHDFQHVERVKKLCLKIGEELDADREVLEVAALFHDIGRNKETEGLIECHAEWSSEKTAEILEERGLDRNFIEKVCECIETHRYSRGGEPSTLESKILSDADNLDALGAVGISRVFSYGGSNEVRFTGEDSSLEHIREKILDLENRIYTDIGREIAEDRQKFVEKFLERFLKEIDAKA